MIQHWLKKLLINSLQWVIKPVLNALVAQLDRATDYESVGRAFESLQAHHKIQALTTNVVSAFFCGFLSGTFPLATLL
jgi:hypothetical protein